VAIAASDLPFAARIEQPILQSGIQDRPPTATDDAGWRWNCGDLSSRAVGCHHEAFNLGLKGFSGPSVAFLNVDVRRTRRKAVRSSAFRRFFMAFTAGLPPEGGTTNRFCERLLPNGAKSISLSRFDATGKNECSDHLRLCDRSGKLG
jgi:hypothetical protein